MLSKFSVKKPYTVLVGVIMAIVLGIVSFTKMSADLLPSISLPYVIVMTTYVGASPQSVEEYVTKPIESSMATVSNIENVSSVSAENYSMVILEFAQSANMDSISLEIRENLDQMENSFADGVGSPIIMKLNPDMLPVMIAAVGMDGMTNGEVSEYTTKTVVPELESIEGVASVSTTGLIEESVNVVIRQDKIDALNEKIFAAIDDKMAEAEQELADAEKELLDGQKELADSKTELADGQAKLDDGKKQLEEGKTELSDKQTETANKLAQTEKDLLTAKADLEAAKTTINTDITTIKQMVSGLDTARTGLTQLKQLKAGLEASRDALLGDASQSGSIANSIAGIQQGYNTGLMDEATADASLQTIVAQFNQTPLNAMLGSTLISLNGLNWTVTNTGLVTDYLAIMNAYYAGYANIASQIDTIENTTIPNLEAALNAKTSGMGADAYIATMNNALTEINKNITTVDNGLTQLYAGNLTAAVEFANAASTLNLTEYQLEQSQSQLDSGKSQLEAAGDQIKEGKEQLEDGKKQLADAKEDAYENADMSGILTIDLIEQLLTAQNFSMPAGYVTEEGTQYLIRIGDKPETLLEMQTLPLLNLNMDGMEPITLGDVADVFMTDNAGEVYTNVNGNPGVMLTIQKQTGYSTGDVSDLLDDRFKDLMEEEEGLSIIELMDQGIYIDLVMDSIINNVLFGALLSILILIFFLRDLRPTLVIACSIPISLITAIVCMYFSGVTLNVISLSGLALGVGMLVDNSIVVIENIYRLRNQGMSMREAATNGAKEVTGAIIASTLTTVCVFLPIVFTEGITRQLFVDMGLTIGYSLLASLVIALTVVPAMASKVLTKTKEKKEGTLLTRFQAVYMKFLRSCLHKKALVLGTVVILLVVSILAALSRGTAYMPEMDSTQMTVSLTTSDDMSLEETGEITDEVVNRLLAMEDIQDVGAMSSSSSMSMLTGGGNASSNAVTIYVTTKEDKENDNETIAQMIMDETSDLLGVEISVETSTMDMSALGGSGISIEVRGRDTDVLQKIATEVAAIMEATEGTTQVSDGQEEATMELRITIDKEAAIEKGLTVAQIYAQIYPSLAESTTATVLTTESEDYDVVVTDEKNEALTRAAIKEMEIEYTDAEGENQTVPLADLASFEEKAGLSSIERTSQTRYLTVSAGIADGYNIGLVSTEVENRLADYQVPDGYQLVFAGENEMINDAINQILLMLLLAVIFMYLIMVAQFQSLLSPFIIMFTIPLAFTGGFFGLYFSGSEVSIVAMIGFVMLAGIIVNNGIVLVDYINQLRAQGMEIEEAILTAGRTRLRPVLMTALTTILAMSTMAFSGDMGADMSRPMAVVTIGGLMYGTLLTLIVIPCVYSIFSKAGRIKREAGRTKRKARGVKAHE